MRYPTPVICRYGVVEDSPTIHIQEVSAIRCPVVVKTVRFSDWDCKKHFQYVRLVGFMPLDITNISNFFALLFFLEQLFE